MDIQKEKSDLIKWLSEVNDNKIIKQFIALQRANLQKSDSSLTDSEKKAIEQGLKSIEEGKVKTHDDVMKITKEKFPKLFK